ncbi:hypothetical protein [Candidatus Sulfurimonas baltica]|nr:hypothetical protein [Candidatus Sulfurimonas baltica]
MAKKAIKSFLTVELLILATQLFSFEFFINLQVAFLSSFFIIIGSTFAYKRMVEMQVQAENINEKRDFLDELEDPYALYEDEPVNNAPYEELDLKEIVKQEKKKIKILNISDIKKGGRAGFSLYRLIPYLFLILGFIALKNNNLLDISTYLPSLLLGIVVGYISSKKLS